MDLNIKLLAEEISNIGTANGELLQKKNKLSGLTMSIGIFERSIASSKAEIEKYRATQKIFQPGTKEDETALKSSISEIEAQISTLKLFDLKKRKELKDKKATIEAKRHSISRYLYYCGEIEKLEASIAKDEQALPAYIAQKAPLTEEIQRLESELSERIDAVVSMLEGSKKVVSKVAESISCPPALLPSKILNVLITDAESPILVGLPLDKQIKLLWDRDIPLRFGGMEWNAMEIQKDRAFLILRGTVYDGIGFCDSKHGSWEKSYGREKLNGEFFERFTDKEKSLIIPNEKSFGDKFTILGKSEIDAYLDFGQCNAHSHWWISGGTYDKYDEENPWRIYYWDSYYDVEYRSSFVNKWIDITYPKSRSDRDHPIGYRPVVWVKIKDDPTDAAWADLWASSETDSISCKGKWKSTRNFVHAPTIFASDLRESFNRIYGRSSTSPRKPIDNFNPNGTPSGHGGRF